VVAVDFALSRCYLARSGGPPAREKRRVKPRWILPLLLLIGIAIRVYYLAGIADSPEFRIPTIDSLWFHDRAASWAEGGDLNELDLFRAPLYPLVLAQLYRIFGTSPYVPRIFQFLLGLGSLYWIYAIGRRAFGSSTAVVAALLALLYYPFVYFEGEILATTLFLFLTLLAAHLLLWARKGLLWRWLLPGLAIGLAATTRPNMLALAPFLLLWLWKMERGKPAAIAILLAGIVVPPAMALARNAIVYGEAQLATQGGVNFFIGNSRGADGKTARIPGTRDISYNREKYEDTVGLAAILIAEQVEGRDLSASEVNRYWIGRSFQWIRSEPAAAAKLFLKKIYFLINQQEIPNNRFLREYVKEYAPVLLWVGLGAGILVSLGGAGLLLSLRSKSDKTVLSLFIAVPGIVVVLFFVCSRFRLPLMPFWILFAAHLLVSAAGRLRALPLARIVPVFFVLLFFSHTHWFDVDQIDDLPEKHCTRAYAFSQVGKKNDAEREYRAALEADPKCALALVGLGTQYAEEGRVEEAEGLLLRVLEIDPSFSMPVWNNLAVAYVRHEEYEKAREFLERAAEAMPTAPDVHENLGNVLMMLGRPEEALAEYDAAYRNGTSRPYAVLLGRAVAVFLLGREEEGLSKAEEVARSAAGLPQGWATLAELARRAGREDLAREALENFFSIVKRPPEDRDRAPGLAAEPRSP